MIDLVDYIIDNYLQKTCCTKAICDHWKKKEI